MRVEIEAREPERDPILAAALREAYPEAPPQPEHLRELRARIRAQVDEVRSGARAGAQPTPVEAGTRPLPRRRVQGWLRAPSCPLLRALRAGPWYRPVLLAAALAGLLLLGRMLLWPTVASRPTASAPIASPPSPAPAPPAPMGAAAHFAAIGFASAEQALGSDLSDREFARVLLREDDPAALLAIAAGENPTTP